MSNLTLPFEIGKTYYKPVTTSTRVYFPCTVCAGKLAVVVTDGWGAHWAVACDACRHGGDPSTGQQSDYRFEPGFRAFTVESLVRMDGSLGRQEYYLRAVDGQHAYWHDLCATWEAALEVSEKEIERQVHDNHRRSTTTKQAMLNKKAWTLSYHKQCLARLEKQVAWHQAQIQKLPPKSKKS